MPNLINFYEKRLTKFDQYNLGDLAASPLRYFQFPGFQKFELNFEEPFEHLPKDSHVIIGGGGILHHVKRINEICDFFTGRKIIWGAGGFRFIEDIQDRFDLIGIREYRSDYLQYFVPCVSCCSPLFDVPINYGTKYVAYFGHKYRSKKNWKITKTDTLVDSFDEFKTKLRYIKAAEKILITSSYHGAYWGLLLHKNLWLFGPPWFMKKFFTLKYREPKIGMLEEFRKLNHDFYRQVNEIILST